MSASKSATWPWSFNRPARQKRQPVWRSPEEVLRRVARLYGFAPPSDLVKPTRRPSEARQVALYGLRWWAGEGLSAIARRMGVERDSAVSRRGTVVAQRLRVDAQFRSRVERVTHVKLKT